MVARPKKDANTNIDLMFCKDRNPSIETDPIIKSPTNTATPIITLLFTFKNLQAIKAKIRKPNKIIADTTELGREFRMLQTQYSKTLNENDDLQSKFDRFRLSGAKETAGLQSDLETKNIELQRKEDALLELEAELNRKSKLLEEREKRVNELEELIKRKDAAVEALRNKVAAAL